MRRLSGPNVLGLCAVLALIAAALPSPAYAARDICVKILQPVKSVMAVKPEVSLAGQAKQSEVWTVEVAIGDCPMRKPFRFQLKYPPRDPGQSSGSVTTQALPVPYMIRATAQVADGTPANNEGIATFRFAPGGTASCLAWK